MSLGLYAYAVASADDRPLPAARGVHPGPLQAVRGSTPGALAAIVGQVEVSEYESPALEENVARPGWLESVVRAHEQVVEALQEDRAVVPMRFGSIFSDEGGVRAMLDGSEARLEALLDELAGRVELGVTVRADRESLLQESVGASAPSTGRDYLRRRQAELRAAEDLSARGQELATEVHARLSAAADRSAVLTSRRADPALLMSGAYLVPRSAVDSFCSAVGAVDRDFPACRLEITGPWPPYSFSCVDVGGAHD